jgi:hypothetical protein
MSEMVMVRAANGLRLRSESPGGPVLTVLPNGTALQVLGRETWLRVRAGDREGYVMADFVESSTLVDAAPAAVATIEVYANSQFIGEPVRADEGFVAALDTLNDLARARAVRIHVTSSLRQPGQVLANTVVEPARSSNHLVGHAIDMNLRSSSGAFNSSLLRRANHPNLPAEIRGFVEDVRAAGLRWGGDFDQEDPVHIDDGLNVRDPDLWKRKFQAIHAA